MRTELQLIEGFLELQEHPKQVTDEQLQQALDDPQMRELVEQLAFAKRAFKSKELQAEELDVEGEWNKFETKNFGERDGDKHQMSDGEYLSSETQYGYTFKKIAALFIGILIVSGMALAAIHIIQMVISPKSETVQAEQPMSYTPPTALPSDTSRTDTTATVQPIVFDNVALDKMLPQIATYYNKEVDFQNADARQLRFYFVWRQDETLDVVLHRLNLFESITVELKSDKIVVE